MIKAMHFRWPGPVHQLWIGKRGTVAVLSVSAHGSIYTMLMRDGHGLREKCWRQGR
jgi:hypothetical protein